MKLSIITATLNNQATISRCLESLSSQTYSDFEHIIVDGVSTDNTLQKIKDFGSVDRMLISEPDKGLYDALNKGIAMAKGDLIGFLHADDYFSHNNVLQNIVDCMNSRQSDGVYGDLKYVTETGSVIRYWKAGEYTPQLIRKGWMPPHPTMFLKRSVYEICGPFDTSYKIAADYEFILRILYRDQIQLTYLPEVIVEMQTGGMSNRNLSNILHKSKEDLRALKDLHLPFPFLTLLKKNFSKLSQLFRK